jgi:CDP-diacylglycerol--glycerol-3-phosphate 3-phosphatidyltransferase
MANALTTIRLILALPFACLMASGDSWHAVLAALTLVAAIATDLLDGPVARRRGTATAAGRAFDHAADFLFVISGLAAGAVRGAFPWILPVLVTAAFAQYVIDSYWVDRRHTLRPSRLGRYNGILYFAPLVGDILVRAGFRFAEPLLTAVVWLLVVSTALSMGERFFWSSRRREQLPRRPTEKQQTDRGVE